MKTFKTNISKINSQVWSTVILIPNNISESLVEKDVKRVVCTVNKSESFQSGLLSDGNGGRFVLLNKERCKKLGVTVGDEVTVTLKKDDSKYGLPMPEEMQELLYQDPEGDTLFHKLTAGKQRSLLHLIGKPKSSNIRLNKALTVINYLKTTGGKLDFKELNQAFRDNKF